ncbi:hypothetical protein BaRGS_00021726 [Batillaria attramentaria]|uniref:Uncharacterized protein n=1 Tax=Batillaria attramentaria TaxID=370345 RepID=A0ABD0KJ92_9CAEN
MTARRLHRLQHFITPPPLHPYRKLYQYQHQRYTQNMRRLQITDHCPKHHRTYNRRDVNGSGLFRNPDPTLWPAGKHGLQRCSRKQPIRCLVTTVFQIPQMDEDTVHKITMENTQESVD